MNSYPLGAVIRVTGTFTTGGTHQDPDGVISAKIRKPDGTISTSVYGVDAAIVREGAGVYHVDVSTTAGGVWIYRFIGTGDGAAANETEFFVQPSDFGAGG